MVVQRGHGKDPSIDKVSGIDVEVYTLKPSISEDIEQASLVISHAGEWVKQGTLTINNN